MPAIGQEGQASVQMTRVVGNDIAGPYLRLLISHLCHLSHHAG